MLSKNTGLGILAPICNNIPPTQYGPWEKVTYNLCRGLVAAGYTNVVLYASREARISGVRTVGSLDKPYGEGSPIGHVLELGHIAFTFERAKREVELLHNHLNITPLIYSKFLGIPIITTLHGPPDCGPDTKLVFHQYKDLPYVSISNNERAAMPELNYVSTVYNGIDFLEFGFGEKPEEYLVYTGRMHPDKGVEAAIQLSENLDLPLYLAGIIQEDQYEYFEEKIAPHLDNRHVFYLGNLSPKEVQSLVSRALAYVGLINWDEPFGLSIAEAMACGTPAIATSRGSHREIVIEGHTGILVNSVEEAVRRFPEIRKIDRWHCRQTAESIYGLEKMTQGYLEVYEKILKVKTNTYAI